jgi:hypothetical protein
MYFESKIPPGSSIALMLNFFSPLFDFSGVIIPISLCVVSSLLRFNSFDYYICGFVDT